MQANRTIATLLILTVICHSVQHCRCDCCDLHARYSASARNRHTAVGTECHQCESAVLNPASGAGSCQHTQQPYDSFPDSHDSACQRLILAIVIPASKVGDFATHVITIDVPQVLRLQRLVGDQHCRLAMSGVMYGLMVSPLRGCMRLQV